MATALPSSTKDDEFMLRLVSLDYYMSKPLRGADLCYSNFLGKPLDYVPTIRIFGATPSGQRACLHVHKVFPYLYVKWEQPLPLEAPALQQLLKKVATALETAMQQNLQGGGRAGPGDPNAGGGGAGGGRAQGQPHSFRPRTHVLSCTLVRAKDFYGFHEAEEPFVKVSLLNPRDVGRAAALLQSGAVLGTRMRTFEAHLPYLLQFKVDHNLYGMGHIRIARGKFRLPLPPAPSPAAAAGASGPEQARAGSPLAAGSPAATVQGSISASQRARLWNAATVPPSRIWDTVRSMDGASCQPPPPRQSVCELELDCSTEAIRNRTEFVRRPLVHDGFKGAGGVTHVESLLPMWVEERARMGGVEPPPPPPDPPRTPAPIGPHVDDVREFFRGIRDLQRQRLKDLHPGGAEAATVGTPAERTPAPAPGPEAGPRSPLLPASLAALTQAANVLACTPYADEALGQATEGEGGRGPRDAAAEVRAQGPQGIPPPPRFDEGEFERTAGPPPPPQQQELQGATPPPPSPGRPPGAVPTQVQRDLRDLIQWLEDYPEEWADRGDAPEGEGMRGPSQVAATPSQPRSQRKEGDKEKIDDLLLELADLIESTPYHPAEHGSTQPNPSPPPPLPLSSQRPPLSSQPPGAFATQREATFDRVQRAVAIYLERTQRECRDIVDCHEDAVLASQLDDDDDEEEEENEGEGMEGGGAGVGPLTFNFSSRDHGHERADGPLGPSSAAPYLFGQDGAPTLFGTDDPMRAAEEERGEDDEDDDFYRFLSSGEGGGPGGVEDENNPPVKRLRGGMGSDDEGMESEGASEEPIEDREAVPGTQQPTQSRSRSQTGTGALPSTSQRLPLPLVRSPGGVGPRGGGLQQHLVTGPAARSFVSGLRPVRPRRMLVEAGLPSDSAAQEPEAAAQWTSPLRAPQQQQQQAPVESTPSPAPARHPVTLHFSPPTIRAQKRKKTKAVPVVVELPPPLLPPHVNAAKEENDELISDADEPKPALDAALAPAVAPEEPSQATQMQSKIRIRVSQAALRARAALFDMDRTPSDPPADPPSATLRSPSFKPEILSPPPDARTSPSLPKPGSEGPAPTEVYVSQPVAEVAGPGRPEVEVEVEVGAPGPVERPSELERDVKASPDELLGQGTTQPPAPFPGFASQRSAQRPPTQHNSQLRSGSPRSQLREVEVSAQRAATTAGLDASTAPEGAGARTTPSSVAVTAATVRSQTTAEGRSFGDRRLQQPPPSPRADREGLFSWRTRDKPPNPATALRSAWEESGVPQAIPLEPFFGDVRDVPPRPTVFAGRAFRLQTNDLGLCPEFARGTAPVISKPRSAFTALREQWEEGSGPELARTAWEKWSARRPALVRGLYAITPASRPPTPAAAAATKWLRQQHGEALSRGGALFTSGRREIDGFVMDPNTGALVPVGGGAAEGAGGSQGSLLATPATQLTPAQGGSGQHAPHAQGPGTLGQATARPASPDGHREKRPRVSSPKYDERTCFFHGAGAEPDSPSGSQEGALLGALPLRAPSPKYDERSFFFSADGRGTASAPAQPRGPASGRGPSIPECAVGGGAAFATMAPRRAFESQVTPPSRLKEGEGTPSQQRGFKKVVPGKGQQMTVTSLEVFCDTRGALLPDPRYDAVRSVVIAELHDQEDVTNAMFDTTIFVFDAALFQLLPSRDPGDEANDAGPAAADAFAGGLALHCETRKWRGALPSNIQAWVVASELDLFRCTIARVRRMDPDVLVGFEVQGGSIGYLNDRFRQLQTAAAAAGPVAPPAVVHPQPQGNGRPQGRDKEPPGLLKLLSRTPEGPSSIQEAAGEDADEYGRFHASGLHCTGRIILNLWRILKSDLKLTQYSLQSCAAAVLRRRVPHFLSSTLAAWWAYPGTSGKEKVLRHVSLSACLVLDMIEQLDLLGRTAELARTFGIDFFAVLTRGSQYRVESMMARLAHTQNYLLLTCSKEEVANQPAMECLPLVMEPESRMYTSPVIVLDFQSLYPSQVIAYNLCFSTCLGKTKHYDGEFEAPAGPAAAAAGVRLGIRDVYAPPSFGLAREELGLDVDKLVITPNGTAFAPPEARLGILPRLLREILDTRVMVKGAMKRTPRDDMVTQRILNARQFGLKLIANVTYGYTAAGFSGRMPMAELADAIVQSGRETLERAIRLVEATPSWGARVVYGDTDSLFVLCEGKTREEAFRIGAEIARAVTAANPPPVTLKLEKVYQPCFLITKKRYVGFKYEDPSQSQPEFDAKGIETVRRDTCPAVAKCMERALRIVFATKDLSQVKAYLTRQWTKILSNRVNIQDFVFAKEVRLGTYSPKAAVAPPAAIVAAKQMALDPRAEPKFGERVPYVVVYGEPGARLVDLVVPPHALVESQGQLRLHGLYYITKQILPALERVFSLVGADLRAWMNDLPRPQRMMPQKRSLAALPLDPPAARIGPAGGGGPGATDVGTSIWGPMPMTRGGARSRGTIDRYYLSRHCAVCDGLTSAARPLCDECIAQPDRAIATLAIRVARLERQHARLVRICAACGGGGASDASLRMLGAGGSARGPLLVPCGGVACESLDCGVYFERRKTGQELAAAQALLGAGERTLQC